MNTRSLKYAFTLLLAGALAYSGCKKFDMDTDELTLSADLSIFKTIVNFTYVDASTGEKVEVSPASRLKVEVLSPISDLIVNAMGEHQTLYYPNYAFCSFSLNPYMTVPTPEKPISILVRTTLNNYLSSSVIIQISEERIFNQEIRLVNEGQLPAGILIEKHENAGTTTAAGETIEPIIINTSGSRAGVQIDAGTTLKDETGKALSGNISVNMMTVDVSSSENYNNVPSIRQPLITSEGTKSSLFCPIAYTRVEIRDGSGRQATSVSGKDIKVSTALNTHVTNPKTKKPITSGDLVPSYYFDSRDGYWKFFGEDTVSESNGQLQLVKVLKSKKSTGSEFFSEITYSFDQETSMDIRLTINLPADKPSLPTTFNAVIKGIDSEGGSTGLFTSDFTLFTTHTSFSINNLNPDYTSYEVKLTSAEMTNSGGSTQILTRDQLITSQFNYTFDFVSSQFIDPSDGDGATRLYLQFACLPTSGNALFMDSPYLPESFFLIFSGTGFTGETILEIQGGSFVVPFNPMLQANGQWQAKVVMGNMEYPEGAGRVSVTNADFHTIDGKVIFKYSPETAEQCDDFKKALGIN